MRARRSWVLIGLGALTAAVFAVTAGGGHAAPARRAQAPPLSPCASAFDLTNGSFETPDVGEFAIVMQDRVTGWQTTEPDGRIELWQSGYNGVPAAAGEQFAELSANQPGELYQDRDTPPGAQLNYSVSHRGRVGVDTMQIRIGPPGGPPNFTRTVSTGKTAWQEAFGTYTVPAGQTVTRFGFAAVHNASGNPTVGNFLDNIVLTQAQCTISVRKRLIPRSDPGRFDLLVGGDVLARAAGDGARGGPVPLPVADTTVSERAAPGTDADDYASAIRCTDANTGELLTQAAGRETTLRLTRPRDISCTAVNAAAPSIIVEHQLEPPGDPGRFVLAVNGRTVATAAGGRTVAGPTRVNAGEVTVSETPAAGTHGAGYAAAVQCRDRAGRGAVIAQSRGRDARFAIARGELVDCLLLDVAQTPPAPAPTPTPPPPPPSPARSVDVLVRARALRARVLPGQTVSFRVRVRNRGPLPATRVRLVPVLRQGARRLRLRRLELPARDGVCAVGPRAGACVLRALAPAHSAALTVTAKTSPRRLAPVRLTVGAVPAETDSRPANNVARARARVSMPPTRPCGAASARDGQPRC